MNKALIKFPCKFTIKVMGVNLPNFIAEIADIVVKHCEDFDPNNDIRTNISKQGNYLSLSITIQVLSQQHLDKIYQELNANSLVKFVL